MALIFMRLVLLVVWSEQTPLTSKYRVGDKEEVNLIIPGNDLTNGDGSSGNYLDITIPIQAI